MRAIRPNKVDFIARYKVKDTPSLRKDSQEMYKWLFLALVAAVMCTLIGLKGFEYYFQLKPELDELNSYIDSQANKDAYDEAQSIIDQNVEVKSQLDNYLLAGESIDSYPEMNRQVYSVLLSRTSGLATVTGISFDRETGALTVNLFAGTPQDIAEAVENLRQDDAFTSVLYYGYTGVSSTSTDATGTDVTAYNYTFTVICAIAAGGTGDE